MHKIKVQNGTNATLQVKARVIDKVKKHAVETHYQVLPKTIVVLTALHFFLEDLPRGMKLLWSTKDEPAPEPATTAPATEPAPAPSPEPAPVDEQSEAAVIRANPSGFSSASGNHRKQGARE